jgi:hypothetical protein
MWIQKHLLGSLGGACCVCLLGAGFASNSSLGIGSGSPRTTSGGPSSVPESRIVPCATSCRHGRTGIFPLLVFRGGDLQSSSSAELGPQISNRSCVSPVEECVQEPLSSSVDEQVEHTSKPSLLSRLRQRVRSILRHGRLGSWRSTGSRSSTSARRCPRTEIESADGCTNGQTS